MDSKTAQSSKLKVRKGNPLKQGLKQRVVRCQSSVVRVREWNPLKQGLKHRQGVRDADKKVKIKMRIMN